ncbi:MAG TPA: hypothetical protein VFZ42_14735 [Chitinophagaceae bacterium]
MQEKFSVDLLWLKDDDTLNDTAYRNEKIALPARKLPGIYNRQ